MKFACVCMIRQPIFKDSGSPVYGTAASATPCRRLSVSYSTRSLVLLTLVVVGTDKRVQAARYLPFPNIKKATRGPPICSIER